MNYVLYTVAWGLMFASGSACWTLYKGEFRSGQLPKSLQGGLGRSYAHPMLFVVWFSGIALAAFGAMDLRLYWIPIGIVGGLLTSAVLQVTVGKAIFAMIGPALLVILQVALWILHK